MTKAKRERKCAAKDSLSELETLAQRNRDLLGELATQFCHLHSRVESLETQIEELKQKTDVGGGVSIPCDHNIQQRIDSISSLMTEYLTSQQTSALPTTPCQMISPRDTDIEKIPCEVNQEILDRILNLENSFRRLQECAQEKKDENSIIRNARKFKSANSVVWSDTMNARKKSYWKYIQNLEKSRLYTNWIKEDADYLPLKYRPKINASDAAVLIEQKTNQAALSYRADISLMRHYTERHKRKTEALDKILIEQAESQGLDECTIEEITQMWEEEVKHNENISEQLWKKRECFLIRMKDDYCTDRDRNSENQLKPNSSFTSTSANLYSNVPVKLIPGTPVNADTCNNWRHNQ